MIERLILRIQSIIVQYGAGGVFIATMIEEIVAPIPSSIVPMMAGFFLLPAQQPFLEIVGRGMTVIAIPIALGLSIGSMFVYLIGFIGGKPVIEKWGKWLGLSWQGIERIERKLIRGYGDEFILFGLRLMPIIPGVAISGFCGLVRYPFLRFMVVTFIGAFTRALALSIIGWKVGGMYTVYAEFVSRIENIILVGVLVITTFFIGRYFIRRKRF